jgi:hypothetical protein
MVGLLDDKILLGKYNQSTLLLIAYHYSSSTAISSPSVEIRQWWRYSGLKEIASVYNTP